MGEKLIYVVDDEKRIRDLIKSYLIKEGYDVKVFEDGDEAVRTFHEAAPDMMILDIMMPGMDGYSVCREIRKNSEVPIIMVSAKDDEIDRVLGLELGSDDYISKPFSPRELVARVKTIFRRVSKSASEINDNNRRNTISCKDVVITPEERSISVNRKDIELTSKEYDFLLFMIQNKNKAFTREQLLNSIWGYDFIGDTRAVDDLVKRVRKKLSSAGSKLEIVTVWGYGYKIME